MIRLNEISLLNLLPNSVINDDIKAAATIIDSECFKVLQLMEKMLVFNIDNIEDEKIVDALAYESHVDFYDQNLGLDVKKKLVKDSLYLHQIKGTKKAVENLVKTLFGDGEVQEWFEYGGEEFYFKVITENSTIANDEILYFMNAVNTVKNARSKLEKVEIHYKLETTERYGLYFYDSEETVIETEAW